MREAAMNLGKPKVYQEASMVRVAVSYDEGRSGKRVQDEDFLMIGTYAGGVLQSLRYEKADSFAPLYASNPFG